MTSIHLSKHKRKQLCQAMGLDKGLIDYQQGTPKVEETS